MRGIKPAEVTNRKPARLPSKGLSLSGTAPQYPVRNRIPPLCGRCSGQRILLQGRVLGKPKDREDALCMLRDMSGRTHEVFTGVCITTTEWQRSFAAQTEVRFAELSEEEITYYVDKFQPMDKAGAYGVQEWIGFIGVENISGSYYNIMGLPVQRLYKELVKV